MKQRSAAVVIGKAAGVALVATGALGMMFPRALSSAFGARVEDSNGTVFVRAAALRDAAVGAIMLDAAFGERRKVLRVAAAAGMVVSAGDFVNAYANAGRRFRPQHVLHAVGATVFAALLFLGR